MIGRGTPPPDAFLLPTKRIRNYFPPSIPAFDSGVVHVVVDNATKESLPLQVKEVQKNAKNTPISVGRTPLPDDKPTRARGDESDEDDEYLDEEIERCGRVQQTLELYVAWGILGTDFSQKHKYQGIQWMDYEAYTWFDGKGGGGYLNYSRVYIGDAVTWRELYVACNDVVEKREGRVGFRVVEAFVISTDGTTLKLVVGT
ncbi:hypothetical protein PHMEG_0001082 [Phytophthora megakarya]|uniref:Uncharacterized protein n=1 Tax=Phytophthora megakarya TaxID=4795 RepID=A0A225X402_9STRA|nr:hypothetical protein PHMEG_0001082 [Phytophthora megakarya]